MSTEVTHCVNCQSEIRGNYCHECGEVGRPKRISLGILLEDFFSNLFALEGRLLRTLKALTLRPGNMGRNYIEGNRKQYYKPFQYFLVVILIDYLAFYFFVDFNAFIDDWLAYMNESPYFEQMEQDKASVRRIVAKIQEHKKYLTLGFIPGMTLAAVLFFRKSGYNYTETFTFFLYLYSHSLLLALPLSVFNMAVIPIAYQSALSSLVFVGTVVYFIWAIVTFYQQKDAVAIFKALGVYFLGVIIFALIAGLAIPLLIL